MTTYDRSAILIVNFAFQKRTSQINTQNRAILPKNAIRYLGVILDHRLTWKDHTRLVVEKLYMARGILRKLKRHAPQSVLKCVYYSLVYPYLHYGVTSWGNTATKYTKTIQTPQNYIVKIINNSTSFKTKLMPIYQQLNLMNLCQIYKLEIIKFMFKYKKELSQTVLKTTLYLHQKPIIILPGLLVMTTGLLHSNIKSQLQNDRFNVMVIKYGMNYR